MQNKFFGCLILASLFAVFLGVSASAQTKDEGSFVSQEASSQSGFPEFARLPIQLTAEQSGALSMLQPPAQKPFSRWAGRQRWARFYRSAYNHPLTPQEVALREAVYRFHEQGNPHQFVRVSLKDGTLLTGAITSAGTTGFVVKTGILGGYHGVAYRDVAEMPREVAAVGTHVVHGLEWTGAVVGCIAVIPLALVFYPLVMAGVIQD